MKVIIPVINDKEAKNDSAPGFKATYHVCIYDCNDESLNWLSTTEISRKARTY